MSRRSACALCADSGEVPAGKRPRFVVDEHAALPGRGVVTLEVRELRQRAHGLALRERRGVGRRRGVRGEERARASVARYAVAELVVREPPPLAAHEPVEKHSREGREQRQDGERLLQPADLAFEPQLPLTRARRAWAPGPRAHGRGRDPSAPSPPPATRTRRRADAGRSGTCRDVVVGSRCRGNARAMRRRDAAAEDVGELDAPCGASAAPARRRPGRRATARRLMAKRSAPMSTARKSSAWRFSSLGPSLSIWWKMRPRELARRALGVTGRVRRAARTRRSGARRPSRASGSGYHQP